MLCADLISVRPSVCNIISGLKTAGHFPPPQLPNLISKLFTKAFRVILIVKYTETNFS